MTGQPDSSPPGEYYCPACEKTYRVSDTCPLDGTRLIKLKIATDPFLGLELDSKYTIIEKIGQGGMGAVYRGAQHSVEREVAIKVVSPHLVSDSDVIKRFLREAKLASRLSHPNAVAVFDFNQTDDGVFYLVMELVTGRTLDQVIKAERVFRPERIVRIATQICDALEGAHALQIVHRDLKPANIMLLAQGRDLVKVLDFGLAKSVAPDQTSTTMTNAGALLGTPAFMPPELALGQPCDGRADLYSLGVMVFLMAAGRLPFVSESAHELIALHAMESAPALTDVPPALSHIVARLLEKDPARRFQTATETREAFEAALEGRTTPLPWESHPVITALPTSQSQYRQVGGSRPLRHSEMARIASSDTMAATSYRIRPSRRRWLWPVALAGALAIGGAVFVVANGTSANDEPAAAPAPATEHVVAPAPPPPPPVEAKPAPVVEPPKQPAAPVEQVASPPHSPTPVPVSKPLRPKVQPIRSGGGRSRTAAPPPDPGKKTEPKTEPKSPPKGDPKSDAPTPF